VPALGVLEGPGSQFGSQARAAPHNLP